MDLKNLTMPVLNVFAKDDHIIPPATTQALKVCVGSKDYQELPLPGGHVGVFVGGKSQGLLGPGIANWLAEHDQRRPPRMFANKIVSADEAVAIVRDGDTVCASGFVGIGTPDELILALERRFLKARQPSRSDPRVCRRARRRQGARAQPAGARRVWSSGSSAGTGHWSRSSANSPWTIEIEAYNLPLGVHLASLPRHRCRPARHPLQGGSAHLRRSAPGRRQAERGHDRGPRRVDRDRGRDMAALQGVSDPRGADPGHDLPIPPAISRWSGRR